ncbi:MAG TPA: LysM peptidoglycan-binding domain-containing M23 family metallopeptidase [Alphaproteobacteria bacterium]|nr:LysM peptidoglycan-binding domain-containing M23 family metallopeptidase [Alphaproteobacteria bacterium]
MGARRSRLAAFGRAMAALMPLALAGCGFLAYPAPEEPADVNAPPQAQPLQPQAPGQVTQAAPAPQFPACRPPATGNPAIEIVQRGETLYQVSRCNKVPIRALIDANRLEPPYVLLAGQKLVIPHPQTHIVAAGETLYAIARANDVDVSELVRENALNPPYNIFVGQTLIMPGKIVTGASVPSVPASPREIQQVESLPPPGVPATTIAPKELAPKEVEPVPTPPPESRVANVPAQPTEAPPLTPIPKPEPEKLAALPPSHESVREASREAPTHSIPAPGNSHFIWPVRGKIVSDYGPKSGGLFNDGINIAVPAGTPVRAADSGVVVYAGNEIRGFGNLVLIKHANGWMTAYAHNETLLVHRGEVVQRGQEIAKAGSTGSVAFPQLHFEIRKGSHAVDPTKYLAQLAS